MERSKRKREEESPTVITFHAPTRTFARVFKENTLEETRKLVREKLGLASDINLRLVQLRGGARVDLEDDDDFEAFRALTYSHPTLDVIVSIAGHEVAGSGPSAPPGVSNMISISAPGPRRKKRKGPLHVEDKPSRGPSTISDYQDGGKGQHFSSSTPEVDREVPAFPAKDHVRERHARPSKSQSTNGVAGPSRIADQTPDAVDKISSLPKRNKKKTAAVADDAADEAATSLKKRKGRNQTDPYVDAEHSTIALDLDSVPPEELLPIAKKGKKRKLDADGSIIQTSAPSHLKTPPREEGERPKKKYRKRKEEASNDVHSPSDDHAVEPTKEKSGGESKKHKSREAKHVSPTPATETLASNAAGESSNPGSTPLIKNKKKKPDASATEDPSEPTSLPAHEPADKGRKPRKKKDAEHPSSQEDADAGSSSTVLDVHTKVKQKRKKAVDTTTSEPVAELATPNTPEGSAETEALPKEGKKKKAQRKKGSQSEPNRSSDVLPSTVLNGVGVSDVQDISSATTQVLAATSSPAATRADTKALPKRSSKKSALATPSPLDAIHPDNSQDTSTPERLEPAPQVPNKTGKADKQKGKGRKKKTDNDLPPSDTVSETAQASKDTQDKKIDASNDINAQVMASVARVLATQATKQKQKAAHATEAPENLGVPVVNISPSRKRKPKAGKSRLSQSWAPADFDTQKSSQATFALPPAVDSAQTPDPGAYNAKIVSTPCLVCGGRPWHLRRYCPIITAGAESIEKRILELKSSSMPSPELLKELRFFLKIVKEEEAAKGTEVERPEAEAEVVPEVEVEEVPELHPPSPKRVEYSPGPQSSPRQERDLSPEIPLPSSPPSILASPEIDEVVVEDKDEGSSSESEDDDDDDDDDESTGMANAYDRSEVEVPFPSFATQPEIDEESVQALLRGPVSKRSLLAIFPDDSGTEEDSEPEDVVLAGDEEERDDRAFRRLSRQFNRDQPSSDEESLGDVDLNGVIHEISSPSPDQDEDTQEPDVQQSQTEVEGVNGADEAAPDASKKGGEFGKEVEPEVEPLHIQVDDAIDPSSPVLTSQPAKGLRGPDLDVEAVPTTSPSPAILPQPLVAQQEEPPLTLVVPDETEVVPDSEDRILSPSPKPFSRVSPQEDPADPIEPSDDFPPKPTLQKETEPIEDGPDIFEPTAEDERMTPPPTPLSRPGTAKRMKDRHGKVPAHNSYAAEVAAQIQKSMQASQQQLDNLAAEQDGANKKKAPSAKTAASRTKDKSAGAVEGSMPPPPVPDGAAKRRGRPPLSQEEKDRRAAVREEEKTRKAAERKALKAAEKAANTNASQVKGKKTRKAAITPAPAPVVTIELGGSTSSESVDAVEDILEATPATGTNTPAVESISADSTARPQQTERVAEGPSAFSTPSNLTVRRVVPEMSQSKWAVLPETPQTQDATFEAEESMYDELRSSSPWSEPAENRTFKPTQSQVQPKTTGTSHKDGVDKIPATNGQVAADVEASGHLNADVDAEDPPASPAQDNMVTPTPKPRTDKSFTKDTPDPLFDLSQPVLTPPSSPIRPSVGLDADAASSNSDPDSNPDSNDDDDADDAPANNSLTRPLRPAHWGRTVPFPRLTDIASQVIFAPTPTGTPLHQTQAQAAEERRRSMYSQLGADDDGDSSSSSDSDAEKSHIPKARRAGVRARVSNAT